MSPRRSANCVHWYRPPLKGDPSDRSPPDQHSCQLVTLLAPCSSQWPPLWLQACLDRTPNKLDHISREVSRGLRTRKVSLWVCAPGRGGVPSRR